MDKRMLFVFNPQSGKGQIKNSLFEIIDIFTKAGYIVTSYPTQKKNDAYDIIKNNMKNYDAVTVSGGDGTLNEAIRGMMKYPREERIPIGYIPSGTTNDFAVSRGIPKDPVKAAEKIVNGTIISEDVGMLNGIPFSYVAAFGAFTDVSYDTPQGVKNVLGQAAYVVEGIKRLTSIESYNITAEGEDVDIQDYVCVGCILNSTRMAGISFDGKFDVQLDDGLFEFALVKMPATLMQIQELLYAVLRGEEESEKFRLVRASKLKITFEDDIKWTLDGEYGGAFKDVEFEVKNKAIDFIL